ncbi:phospho-N-acetylmuramoyl-pentapeptide-transferase [Chamaesiphon polymorphus]|uniref:Phospho-N-acetylmuramoyl-pentapeptide-transferase n=1 Tax=Chamaesiphon polymorphus CCALA 037 TaxID=2107692 RepID=A0A2T1GBP5_9CYAN|nr:phospho-N-acetylmuramoyl-pentapeptide-transferase [Chamaesiphon polymorphus]PSB54743.1 phospho-N-acetylmuramoyl-pentapeptide-transferase [Chamaesiphon polymorphus CCALA 037]
MEDRSVSARGFNPTGTVLLILLGLFLTGAVLWVDWQNGKSLMSSLLLPFAVSTGLVTAIGYQAIPLLKQLKMGQFIREDGPQAHLKKAGTPTMGGVFVVPIGTILGVIWSQFNPDAIAVALTSLGYFAIGGVDDWKSLSNRKNEGLTPKGKLLLQTAIAIAFCGWAYYSRGNVITNVHLPFQVVLPLGLLFWGLAIFALLAESNATNLTDGVDGLAGGTGAIALAGLAAIILPKEPSLAILCICLSGSYLGFVVHNRNKAKVFMGDTGSLALGGALAAVGILTENLWVLFILSGIFAVEALSVTAQVGYYKATKDAEGKGKRLFKMAPIHHHLELSGWTETQVVGVFYAIEVLLVIISLLSRQTL